MTWEWGYTTAQKSTVHTTCSCCQKQTRKGDLEEGEVEESEEQLPVQGGKSGWDTKALKHAVGLKDEDLVYVSFTSEV